MGGSTMFGITSLWLLAITVQTDSFSPSHRRALTRKRTSLSAKKNSSSGDLIFESGGVPLEPQDAMPPIFHPYHSKNLELTEEAFNDPFLKCKRGISYGPEPHQLLDVWRSATSKEDDKSEKLPVVVFLHGGGWDWGYREYAGFAARTVCQEGAVMVAPSYKLGKGTEMSWPQSRDDVIAALDWVTRSAEEHGGDPYKIILAGHSAGGHLAAAALSGAGQSGFRLGQHIKALFLISAPLGYRADDIFLRLQKRWWFRRILYRPAKFLYHRFNHRLKLFRAIVGYGKNGGRKGREETRVALEDSSLLHTLDYNLVNAYPLSIHATYAPKDELPCIRENAEELGRKLGRNVEILELPRDERFGTRGALNEHFGTHWALNDASSSWYNSFRKVLSQIKQPVPVKQSSEVKL